MRSLDLTFAIILLSLIAGCNKSENIILNDSRDGNRYECATFGGEVWMLNNLRYLTRDCYCKGMWIFAFDENEYAKALTRNINSKTGVLYDWKNACEKCPPGWHLPSAREWEELVRMITSDKAGSGTGISSLNLEFEGFARSYGKFCIYDGTTYWTSDTSINNPEKGIAVVFQLESNGRLSLRFEEHDCESGFFVRAVMDEDTKNKNTHY